MDVYEMVAERIIKQLEQGTVPWKKPWANCLEGAFNRIRRKSYSLLNQLILSREGEYGTYKQWQQIGGQVKKGARSEIVVFWKMQEKLEKNEEGMLVKKQIPLLRYYNVFHVSQVDNVMPLKKTENFETEPIAKAEEVLQNYVKRERIRFVTGETGQAYYRPSDDSITLPSIKQFAKAEEYYSTAFHECGHSTLKASRCDREAENKDAYFGTSDYSREELVAEITSAAVLHSIGIETPDTFANSAAYIQNWLHVLRNDKRFVVSSSGKAEKAVRYILGI